MLIIFIKTIIIAFLVFFVIRLMGKRQIGEMQPFELVITLILAEVACLPMNDPYIPLYNGIVPIVTLAFLDILFTVIARKSLRFRHLTDGKSVIVIDKDGIVYDNLKKMNMNIDDLIEAARSAGYPDLSSIQYAIIETNGTLSVIEKTTDPTKPVPAYFPIAIIIDGIRQEDNIKLSGITSMQISKIMVSGGLRSEKEILFMDIRQDGSVYVYPKRKAYYTRKISISGGKNW